GDGGGHGRRSAQDPRGGVRRVHPEARQHPRAAGDADPASRERAIVTVQEDLERSTAVVRAGARILVVDDTPPNVKLLEDLLGFHGYEVEAAASGEEALEMMDERAPDLVLLDILMPGLSGYDVCRAIRSNPRLQMLPVVMVTA